MGRQIVQRPGCALRSALGNVGKFAHAGGEVDRGAVVCDFDLAPGTVHVEEDEQVGRAIALIVTIVALELDRLGRDRLVLERADFIKRPPRATRSIELLVDPDQLLELAWSGSNQSKSLCRGSIESHAGIQS